MGYLTGVALKDAIGEIMAGDNPRMCVAFLGRTWPEELFETGERPKDLRVICDLQMGGTVRAALKAGGAPDNPNLRHIKSKGMHAKVYLSDLGAVVGSANASKAAFDASRIEVPRQGVLFLCYNLIQTYLKPLEGN